MHAVRVLILLMVAGCAGGITQIPPATSFLLIAAAVTLRWVSPALLPARRPVLSFFMDVTALCGGLNAGLSFRDELSLQLWSWTAALWLISLMFGSIAAAETNRRALRRRAHP